MKNMLLLKAMICFWLDLGEPPLLNAEQGGRSSLVDIPPLLKFFSSLSKTLCTLEPLNLSRKLLHTANNFLNPLLRNGLCNQRGKGTINRNYLSVYQFKFSQYFKYTYIGFVLKIIKISFTLPPTPPPPPHF